MTPSLLLLNGIALLAPPLSLHNGRPLSVQHKHRIYNGLHNLLFSTCLHAFFSWLANPSFFVSLHPASFSTCAGCMPGLQTRLCVFPALATCHASLPGSLPHHPGNLTTVCPSPRSTIPLQPRLVPERPADAPRSRQKHPEAIRPTPLRHRWGGLVCLSVRLGEEGGYGAKVSSHCIMRLAICSFRAWNQKGYSLQKSEIISVKCFMGCQLPKFLNSPPFLWVCYQSLRGAVKTRRESALKSMYHQLFLWFSITGRGHSLLKFVAGELGLLGVESRVSE